MANERHTDQREWDIDFSTRQSVHAVTKYSPFREALSTQLLLYLRQLKAKLLLTGYKIPELKLLI